MVARDGTAGLESRFCELFLAITKNTKKQGFSLTRGLMFWTMN